MKKGSVVHKTLEDAVKKDMQQGSEAVQAVAEQIHEIVEIPQQPTATTIEPPSAEAPVHVAEEVQPQMELKLESTPEPQAAPNKNT